MANIAEQLLQIAMTKIFQSPAADGAVGAIIAGLGFADGGFTGNGDRKAVAGVVHGQEFVVNAAATAKNRGMLEAINTGKMPAIISPNTSPALTAIAGTTNNVITLAPSINISGGGGSQEQNKDMADQMSKALKSTMQQLIAKELRQQMRPRGMLNM